MKGQDKAMARDVNGTDVNNTPNGEFKNHDHKDVHWTWGKNGRHPRDPYHRHKRVQESEMKRAVKMNSKLEEAEEQINDLEDKVMERSEAEETKTNYPMQE